MGRTLEQFIASLPKEQQEQIEAQYQTLRRDYLILQGSRLISETETEESREE